MFMDGVPPLDPNTSYYNQHAEAFYERTIGIGSQLAISDQNFLPYLPKDATILDAGSGTGRDAARFLKLGYKVTALDPSEKMVECTKRETGLTDKQVLKMTFQEMSFKEEFDGVWASASLIHVPYDETRKIYEKIHAALKPAGIFYGSYKYGTDCMENDDRTFWNMTEATVLPYLKDLFEILHLWDEPDYRSQKAPSPNQKFLYFVARKIS